MSSQTVSSIHTGRRRPQFQLHHRLALAMDDAGVSPAEMAAHLKCSTGTISNYRNAHTTPQRGSLALWAAKCDVDFEWLVGEDENTASDLPVDASGCNLRHANVPASVHLLRSAG